MDASIDAFLDFSHCGYEGGGTALPFVPGKIEVNPTGQDDAATIQAALDTVGELPFDTNGFRGAVVLRAGTYRIEGQLKMNHSGVVLRGEDARLIAAGPGRRTLIKVGSSTESALGPPRAVKDDKVAAGSNRLTLENLDGLAVGSRVVVRRPSTSAWINSLGMGAFLGNFHEARLDWLPGSRDLEWDRTISSIDDAAHAIVLDSPITTSLEKRFGGGTLHTLLTSEKLRHVGIEGLYCISEFDTTNRADEEHAWMCIALENTEDSWVQGLTARHFVSAAVWVGCHCKGITVQDCRSEDPIAENGGARRLGFYVGGQHVLVQRCLSELARHAFAAGLCSAGPNVFLDCSATDALAESGSFESWASGVLFDRVTIEGSGLALTNVGERLQAAGWTAANSILWNCRARSLSVDNPPGADNHAVTHSATLSLYKAQLERRAGETSLSALSPVKRRAPESNLPRAAAPNPLPLRTASKALSLVHGRYIAGDRALFGSAYSNAWWKGQSVPFRARELGFSPTRWAPGRIGPGLTEDLSALAEGLAKRDCPLLQVWPGLWYDRRRDDHLTAPRLDAEVMPPFYEGPWARSGHGQASDGLSKYDLTRFNPWYFARLRELASCCEEHGIVMVNHLYNNHNLQEAAAHWTDFPWRPANCLQETGFPEPPPYDHRRSRINVAEQFYDIAHPVRRELHRAFIWHTLDTFQDCPNVIHTLGFQFAGPLGFQQFFLDTVSAWENARSRHARIALITSKAITDAILADSVREAQIEMVDTRYWQRLDDGTLFAPNGEGKRSFREFRLATFGTDIAVPSTADFVYATVREYTDRFPEKAIVADHGSQGSLPILMAGGAFSLLADYAAAQPLKFQLDDGPLFAFVREYLSDVLMKMKPLDGLSSDWCLAEEGRAYLLYSPHTDTIQLSQPLRLRKPHSWWFNPRTGVISTVDVGDETRIAKPTSESWLLLVRESS